MAPQTGTAEPYIFISYASADRERVLPVVAALQAAGVAVWLDQQGIAGGANYGTEIADAIKGAAAFVLMASAASLVSRNVKQEIALGWRFERPYLPLLLEAVTIPDDLAYWLEAAQWIEVLDKPPGDWLPKILAALAPFGIIPTGNREMPLLAGREREMALLRERLAAATAGQGNLVLIGGEAGIGKTTLAVALCAEAGHAGALVLTGHCFDLAETPPYGPWIDLFAHCPTALSLPPVFAERGTVGAVPSQMALFVQVEDFLTASAAARPVVLLLDDLHWSDPASLDLLRFLPRSLATHRLLILVTYRSDELTRRHPLYALLPQLAREEGAERIALGRLDDDAVRNLVSNRYGLPNTDTERLTAYLLMRAEGNALFVGELLRSLEEANALRRAEAGWALGTLDQTAVPPLLRQVIDGRLARLDAESQRLLGVAAIIGHEIPLAVWAAVGEADEDALLDLTERAEEANLLVGVPDGTSVRFAHALIREALYEGLPSIRRRRVHQRVGEALTATSNPDPDAVSYHFQQAGDDRALPWLLQAGERAQAAYAWYTAVVRFADALAAIETHEIATPEKGWLLFRLGGLYRYMEPLQAVARFEQARRFADQIGDTLLAAMATAYGGSARNYAHDLRRGISHMGEGIAMLDALIPAEHLRYQELLEHGYFVNEWNPYATYAVWLSASGRHHDARALAERILAEEPDRRIERRGDNHRCCDAYQALARVLTMQGQSEEAHRTWALAVAAYQAIEHHTIAAATALWDLVSTVLPYQADQIVERQRVATEAEEEWLRASGSLGSIDLSGRIARLPLLLLEGAWSDIWQLTGSMEGDFFSLQLRPVLPLLAHAQGDVGNAWDTIHELLPDGYKTGLGDRICYYALTLQRLAADLSIDAGETDVARQWLEAHDRWLDWSDSVLGRAEGQLGWTALYRAVGDSGRARQHAERALAHATEPRTDCSANSTLRQSDSMTPRPI